MHTLLRLLVAVVLTAFGAPRYVAADIIVTPERTYRGTILLGESDDYTIQLYEDKSIVRVPAVRVVRVEFGDHALNPAAPSQPAPQADRAGYVVVPIRGEFGKEILAPGVDGALRQAAARGHKHIVFVIDSPGGSVADAQAVSRVLAAARDRFTYIAVVRRALSAAVWVLAHCDAILAAEPSNAGAAVAYTLKPATGEAAVDEKLLAAIASELAAIAEVHKQNPDIYRAMVQPHVELWLVRDAKGSPQLTSTPAGTEGALKIDDDASVLAMSAGQMFEWRFAIPLADGDPQRIGAALNIPNWTSAKNLGEMPMRQARRDLDSLEISARVARERFDRACAAAAVEQRKTSTLVQSARDAEPGLIYPTYRWGSPLNADARRRWNDAVDNAINRWSAVLAASRAYAGAIREAGSASVEHARAVARIAEFRMTADPAPGAPLSAPMADPELVAWGEMADREIARLRSRRDR